MIYNVISLHIDLDEFEKINNNLKQYDFIIIDKYSEHDFINKAGSHWIALKRVRNAIFVFDSFSIAYIPMNIFKVYKNYKIITNIYRIQDISSNLCGMFCVLFILYDIKSKNDFIKCLTLFNSNNFLKNESI